MSESICAVVVTYNRKELLRLCLLSVLAQTRRLDCIVVVDNASTDGTQALLDSQFPQLERLTLTSNTGGAGGFKAGMQWAQSRGYDWVWVMDDDIELVPECLETMLKWQDIGDVIQVRKLLPWGPLIWEGMWDATAADTITFSREISFENGKSWTPVQFCNFEGALIRRSVIEKAGLPDERYFIAGDDTIYGFIASLHSRVIYVDYIGIIKKAVMKDAPKNRMAYYVDMRNRFLTYEHLVRNGAQIARKHFLLLATIALLSKMKEAASSKTNRGQNMKAVFDGFRDGLRGRFGPPPWIRDSAGTSGASR